MRPRGEATDSDALSRGRRAFQRRAWGECYAALADADREKSLTGDQLKLYATVAYLIGRTTESIDLWTRAHSQYIAVGNATQAARCAIRVGMDLLAAGERVRGAGWIDKARRLLDEHAADCAELGYLMLPEALRRICEGDAAGAAEIYARAAEIGRQFGDSDLIVCASHGLGRAMIRCGQVRDG